MNISKIITAGIGLGLIISAGAVSAGELCYDGYCDGLRITYDTSTGTASGVTTGCAAGNVFGTVGTIAAQGAGVTLGYDAAADYVGLVTAVKANRTWVHYVSDGAGGITVLNSGTWTPGPCAANVNAAPSSVIR